MRGKRFGLNWMDWTLSGRRGHPSKGCNKIFLKRGTYNEKANQYVPCLGYSQECSC